MNIGRRAAHYLRDTSIDFTTFFILGIAVRDKDNAVVILAPRYPDTDPYFLAWYKGERHGFQTIDRMMAVLVEGKFLNRFAADRLIRKFNNMDKTDQGGINYTMIHSSEYSRHFWNAMRRGDRAEFGHLEHNSTGEYLFPAEAGRKYEEKLAKVGVFRQIATVAHSENGDSKIWTFDSDDAAEWIGDGALDVRTAVDDFTPYSIVAHKLAAIVRLGNEFSGDLKFDIEDYLTTVFAKKFAKAEDAAFIGGNGDDMPMGILHTENGAEIGATSAAMNSISFDELTRLYFSVKPDYRSNAVWLMNDETAQILRALKDSAGNFLWRGSPESLMDRPVVISNAMPSIVPGTKPVAFGDFSYYWIVIRSPLTVRPLNELFAARSQSGYLGNEVLDGRLIRPEAVKVLQMSAAE